MTHCIPIHLGALPFAVSLETITALPLPGGLSRIQVETQVSFREKGMWSRNKGGGEVRWGGGLQMALKSAGLKVLITVD